MIVTQKKEGKNINEMTYCRSNPKKYNNLKIKNSNLQDRK